MIETVNDIAIAQAKELLNRYAFDLKGYTAQQLVDQWLTNYQASWIRLATIEALYLGRYKAVSVEQILNVWTRLSNPNIHFNHDFERLICRNLPRHLTNFPESLENIHRNYKLIETSDNVSIRQRIVKESVIDSQPFTNSFLSKKRSLPSEQQPKPSEAADQSPIHQFTPSPPNASGFYNKLKALAQQSLEENGQEFDKNTRVRRQDTGLKS